MSKNRTAVAGMVDYSDPSFDMLQAAGQMHVVRLDVLQVDRGSYQRDLQSYHRKIARDFDPRACPPLIVGRRPDKSLWIIDGQQRREALLKLEIKEWNAIIFNTTGPEMEARIFAICGGGKGTTRQLKKVELYKAMISAKDPLILSVNQAVEEAGFKIHLSARGNIKEGVIGCHGTIIRIVRKYGPEVLVKTLRLIKKTWPESRESVRAEIIGAVGTLEGLHHDVFNEETFYANLCRTSPLAILQESMVGGHDESIASRALRAIVKRYNAGLKKPMRIPDFGSN